jgi:lysophospholipase L1-like esterase
MKKLIIYALLAGVILFIACALEDPTKPEITTINPNILVLTKMVAIGNSLTAGVQSGGIVEDFQLNSYPYLIAQQMGQAAKFEQPLVAQPGVGEIDLTTGEAYGPLKFENGQIVQGDPVPGGALGVQALGKNLLLPRPYDNLGLPGANVNEILTATGGGLWDLILRNPASGPNFGNTTALEQAKLLNPTLVLLWAGCNDVLGAALDGGDPSQITAVADFQASYAGVLGELSEIRDGQFGLILANVPNVTDIPYVNLLDSLIYRSIPALGIMDPVPVVFDATFQPVLFNPASGLYLPLLTEETNTDIAHMLLPFLSEYQAIGLGVPDSAALVGFGLPAGQASALVQGMIAAGLQPSGQPIPGTLTLTAAESAAIQAAVAGYNQVIAGISASTTPNIPVIPVNSILNELNTSGYDGYSGKFVFFDPANTAFSLDGVHPNNGGYAIIANEFIKVMNQFPDIQIPLLNTADYKGQYTGMLPRGMTKKAVEQAKAFFVK